MIRLKPDFAHAYYNRGNARRKLGDYEGAIADLRRAANLFLEQRDTEGYQHALNQIRSLE